MICAFAWVILIPYLAGNDVKSFNPLEEVLDNVFIQVKQNLIQNKEKLLVKNDGELSLQ